MNKGRLIFLLLVLVISGTVFTLAQQETPQRQGIRPDAPTYAIRGPHAVGAANHTIDDGNERVLEATIWYPALNPR